LEKHAKNLAASFGVPVVFISALKTSTFIIGHGTCECKVVKKDCRGGQASPFQTSIDNSCIA
jgi:hypothetical protein